MREVWLLCEGSDNSLDTRVIDALVIQRFFVNARVEPVGGDRSFGEVRSYLLRSSGHGPQLHQKVDRRILCVQDRNYQPVATAASSWQVADQTKFIWHRHEIENYLLHPVAVKRALDALTGHQHPYQTPADVDRTLDVLRRQRATFHPSPDGAAGGDRVKVDFAGTIDGVAFAGGQATDSQAKTAATATVPTAHARLVNRTPQAAYRHGDRLTVAVELDSLTDFYGGALDLVYDRDGVRIYRRRGPVVAQPPPIGAAVAAPVVGGFNP